MDNGIYQAVSGAVAQQRAVDVVANNLANTSTPGFKADSIAFAEVLAKAARTGLPKEGSFVRPDEVRLDLRPGVMRPTGSPTDVALEGKGYLSVAAGGKTLYTRGGTVRISPQGLLTDRDGLPFLNTENKPVQVGQEPAKLIIGRDGSVSVGGERITRLKLVEFQKPQFLERLGGTRYAAPQKAEAKLAVDTQVIQGQLEMANVNPVRQISAMITANRAYEAFHRVITTFRQMDAKTISSMGR